MDIYTFGARSVAAINASTKISYADIPKNKYPSVPRTPENLLVTNASKSVALFGFVIAEDEAEPSPPQHPILPGSSRIFPHPFNAKAVSVRLEEGTGRVFIEIGTGSAH